VKAIPISLACVLAAAVGTARADVPAWCKADGVKKQSVPYDIPKALAEPSWRAIGDIVALTCWPDKDTQPHAAAIAAARTAWSKRLQMTDGDWLDAAVFYSLDHISRDHVFGELDGKVAWSKLSPMEQYYWLGRLFQNNLSFDPHYMADALGPRLSELGRLQYITKCLGGTVDAAIPTVWAMCQPDIARLDRVSLSAELSTDKLSTPVRRMKLRLELLALDEQLAKRRAEIEALIERDAEYAKLFELAEATRKDWDARWKTDAELLDLVLAMDDARITGSRKATAGCEARTWPALQKVISSIPAARFTMKSEPGNTFLQQAAGVILFEPRGYLAATAHSVCLSLEGKPDVLGTELGGRLVSYAGYRGPRNATHMAIRAANIVLDDRKASIEYPQVHRPSWFSGSSVGYGGGSIGVVAKLETADDQITITFPKQPAKTKVCSKTKQTNRVTRIRDDGSLVYDTQCIAYAIESYDKSPRPQTVHARYIDGVKKGVTVEAGPGVVERVWPNANATAPSYVLGAPVK
jgi:hypothetical protein